MDGRKKGRKERRKNSLHNRRLAWVFRRESAQGNGFMPSEARLGTKKQAPAIILLRYQFSPRINFDNLSTCQHKTDQSETHRKWPLGWSSRQNKLSRAHVCRLVKVQNMSAGSLQPTTPKKVYSRKGRKPKPPSADDFCRVCKCCLKNTYGTLGSFVNVYKKSERAEIRGLIVAGACASVGLRLDKSSSLSARVCPPCSRKVKTFGELYALFTTEINKPRPETGQLETTTKRLVSLTPGKSPSRKTRRISTEPADCPSVELPQDSLPQAPASRRRILQSNSSGKENDENLFLNYMNIEELVQNKTTSVKVLILSPNGDITIRTPKDKITSGVIKNLAGIFCWYRLCNGEDLKNHAFPITCR